MISERSFTKEWLLEVNQTLDWNRQEAQLKNYRSIPAGMSGKSAN